MNKNKKPVKLPLTALTSAALTALPAIAAMVMVVGGGGTRRRRR